MTFKELARRGSVDVALGFGLALATLAYAPFIHATRRPGLLIVGLGFAVPLLAAGLLQRSARRAALLAACAIHSVLLAVCGVLLLLCVFLAITIVLLVAAVLTAVPTLLLAANSSQAIRRLIEELRQGSEGPARADG